MKKILTFLMMAIMAVIALSPMKLSAETAESYLKDYNKISDINDQTITGADFSYYQVDKEWGKSYYNYKNQEVDVFEFVKSQGINTISVKAFVDASSATGDGKYFSLENAAKTIKEAKSAGLDTNLVLYYSDDFTWASSQTPPSSWYDEVEGSTDMAVIAHAKNYTNQTLNYLQNQDAIPSIITIGNEIDYNFLNLSGDDAWRGWKAMGDITWLIKNFDSSIKISIGIADKQGNPGNIQYILTKLNDSWNSVQYDYVAVTVYDYDDLNTNIAAMRDIFQTCESDAGKNASLYIANACFARKSSDGNASVENQAKRIYELLDATISESNAGGLIYEKAEFVGAWESFFDNEADMSKGCALSSMAIFAYARGNQVDVSSEEIIPEDNPYKYGTETGLKDVDVTIKKVPKMDEDTIRGVDISTCLALKNAGVKFYDDDGNEQPLMKVLADHGINYVRIRIWNDPFNAEGKSYGGGICDVSTGLKIAEEADKYGMKVLLDFMYSDFWADPTLQTLPKAWKADKGNTTKMCNNIYQFTKDTVSKFTKVCDVGMVQIGNEISSGFCEVFGSYKSIWETESTGKTLCAYINSGSKAVKEVSPNTLVVLQLETPSVAKYEYIMNIWEKYHVNYDVLGSSCYPFWRQYANGLSSVINMVKNKGKLFCVLETSWMNTLEDADGTTNQIGVGTADISHYTVGPQGQVDWLADLYNCITSYENGLGAFYWEPAWIPVKPGWINWEYNNEMSEKYGTGWATSACEGYYADKKLYYQGKPTWGGSSWDNQSLFDFNGHPLKSLDFYKDSWESSEKRGSIILSLVDEQGNRIGNAIVVKDVIGKEISVKLPQIKGYKRDGYTYEVKIENAQSTFISVIYKKIPVVPALAKNHMSAKAIQKGTRYKISWSKVNGATGYKVYMAVCGKKMKLMKNVKKATTLSTISKKINTKSQYKISVVAYKKQGGKDVEIDKALLIHVVGNKNKKYTNVSAINGVSANYTLGIGKTFTLKAKIKKTAKKKVLFPKKHVAQLRYVSDNPSIATVTSTGKITGKLAGTCNIYIVAGNGLEKKVKITVK